MPLKNGVIGDDTRIKSSLPTIKYALEQGATVVLASHLGTARRARPNPRDEPAADRGSRWPALLGKPVTFADRLRRRTRRSDASRRGDVVLLENLRFHPEEEKNDAGVRDRRWHRSPTRYVNDAFGAAHRAHASVEAITHICPARRRPGC